MFAPNATVKMLLRLDYLASQKGIQELLSIPVSALAMMEPRELLLMLFQLSSMHSYDHCFLLSILQPLVHGHDLLVDPGLAPWLCQYHNQCTKSH